MKRPGQPEDLDAAVVFLAAEASRYVTGQTLLVDGGISTGATRALVQQGQTNLSSKQKEKATSRSNARRGR
jgi:gluconate 5-dehydrogenase